MSRRAAFVTVVLAGLMAFTQPASAKSPEVVVQAELGPNAPPVGHSDYSMANAGLSDVRNLLNGGSAARAGAEADRRNAALEAGRAAAQALRRQVEELAAKNQAHETPHSVEPVNLSRLLSEARIQRSRIDLASLPDPDESALPYRFGSAAGPFRDKLVRLYKDLHKIEPRFGKERTARELGLIAVEEADRSFSSGTSDEAEDAGFFAAFARDCLDIAVGLDPVTGFARSAYELFFGHNLITGVPLGRGERTLAFLGVATAGGSRFLTQTGRGVGKLLQRAAHLIGDQDAVRAAVREGERLIQRSAQVLAEWKAGRALDPGEQLIRVSHESMLHVLERHILGGSRNAAKSIFHPDADILELVRKAEAVEPLVRSRGHRVRIVTAMEPIGVDVKTGKWTRNYTVITSRAGDLVTMFPGTPRSH